MKQFWRAHRLAFIAMASVLLVGNSRTGLYVTAMGGIVDTATSGPKDGRSMLFWLGIYVTASLIEQLYWIVKNVLSSYLHDHGAFVLREKVFRRAATAMPLSDSAM